MKELQTFTEMEDEAVRLELDGQTDKLDKLDIIHLFGKEKLENIQSSLSKATGLAFITVDYRGEPITEPTYFTRFCRAMRENQEVVVRCKSSDAFGSIQAAVTQKPSVYFCPCGLLEVAIPIVVRDHYLGGFIGGQVRCEDAPEDVSRLEKVMHIHSDKGLIQEFQKCRDEIPIYSYEKVKDIANLVFLVINQLSENEVRQQMEEEALKKRSRRLLSSNQRLQVENRRLELRLQEMQVMTNPYNLVDTLTSIENLSIIEDAPRTGALIAMFAEYIKYSYLAKDTFIQLSRELEHIERYLMMQQFRLGDRLSYSIQIPKKLSIHKIPSQVLIPFIENSVYNGIMQKKEGGMVEIRACRQDENLCVEITDNGPGLSQEDLAIRFEELKDNHEGFYIRMGMEYARAKMKRLFGDEYDVVSETKKGRGSRTLISWPEHFDERAE